MSTQPRCHCQSCTIRNLTGPAVVITVGVLFLLHQVHGGLLVRKYLAGDPGGHRSVARGFGAGAAGWPHGRNDASDAGIPPSPPAGPPPPVSSSEGQ